MASAPPDPHPDSPPPATPAEHPDQLTPDGAPGRSSVEEPADDVPGEG